MLPTRGRKRRGWRECGSCGDQREDQLSEVRGHPPPARPSPEVGLLKFERSKVDWSNPDQWLEPPKNLTLKDLKGTQGSAADPDYWKGEVFAYVGLPQYLKDLKDGQICVGPNLTPSPLQGYGFSSSSVTGTPAATPKQLNLCVSEKSFTLQSRKHLCFRIAFSSPVQVL